MYLIDTNILIYFLNGEIPSGFQSQFKQILATNFNISIISKIELLGFKRHSEETFQSSLELLSYSVVLPLTSEIADLSIDLKRNCSIKTADSIIAATALKNNLTLITRNTKDFENVKLKILNPFSL